MKKIVACGGGEPLDEPDFIYNAISACSRLGIEFEIYTSGISLAKTIPVEEYIKLWKKALKSSAHSKQRIEIRLSVDPFHEEILGLSPIIEWIKGIEKFAPDWSISLRGIRFEGDHSITRLANILDAELHTEDEGTGFLKIPSGRKISIIWKGFVFEGRGQLKQLRRLGLELTKQDTTIFESFSEDLNSIKEIGRPLSKSQRVSFQRIALEIHANCVVHVLNAQAIDLRLNLLKNSWNEIKEIYYRDPILHCIVENSGLSGIGKMVIDAQQKNFLSDSNTPFSLEKITDLKTLSWLTSSAILTNCNQFKYSDTVIKLAKEYLNNDKVW